MYPEYEEKKKINGGAVARIVIWSVVLVVLTGLLVCAFVFGENGFVFGLNLGTYAYGDAETYEIGGGVSGDTITAIDIDWIDGSVEIKPTDGDKIVITENYDGDEESRRLRWKVEAGTLVIKYRAPGWGSLLKGDPGKDLTVEVPREMLDAMNEVDIVLVSADLTVTGLRAAEVDVDLVSGEAELSGFFSDLDLDTVSGNVQLEGRVENVNVDGTSARIELILTEEPITVDVDTVSGDVSVFLPRDVAGFEASMDAVSGSITVYDFENLSKSMGYCRYGNGSVKINVDAVSGNLEIGRGTPD